MAEDIAMSTRSLFIATLVGMLVLVPRARADCLDRTFAVNGWSLEPRGAANAIVRQPDGKLVVAGVSKRSVQGPPNIASDFLIARYDADGALDPTFGSGGSVVTAPLGGVDDASAAALAIQSDGKLVAAGSVARFTGQPPIGYDPPQLVIIRYDTDGTLDATFGNGGIVLGGATSRTRASGIVVLSDGRLVVGGTSLTGPFGAPQFFFARYDADGTLDSTFGTGGSTVFGAGTGNALARQPDGKLALAGAFHNQGVDSFSLARVDADGVPDAGFGTGGVVVTNAAPPNGQNAAEALVVQADGKLVAGGYGGGFTLVRYEDDGSLDATFGTGGIARTLQGTVAFALTLDSAGRFVAAGDAYDGLDYNVVVARFAADGTLDTSFGTGGAVATDFNTQADDVAKAVVVQPDGAIVVGGSVGPVNVAGSTVLLARYPGTGCTCETPDCTGTTSTTTIVQTSSTTTTTAPPACLTFAGRNRLVMTRRPGSNDRIVWKWTRSLDALDLDDTGDPTTGNLDYDLALYDGAFGGREVAHWPYFSAGTCTGDDACWKATGHGFKFTFPLLGISVNLRTGPATKGQLRLRWRHPSIAPGGPLTPPVEIRFTRSDGRTCFVSRFPSASIRTNDGLRFDGR
jgi:uncharacterized delta-60 repeat protein